MTTGITNNDKQLVILVIEPHRRRPRVESEWLAINEATCILVECKELRIIAIVELIKRGENHILTVAVTQQWGAIETTIKVLVALVAATARRRPFPHLLTCESINFHKMSARVTATLQVHFAATV